MKIYGIFRGFPGLGRVVAGAGILSELRDRGHEVKAYSYLQGIDVLQEYNINNIAAPQPDSRHIMVIGLNPISNESGILIHAIVKENPDIVIIDGEPLITSTLSMVFPKDKIICLLNKTDIDNKLLPTSTIKFYRFHYLCAGYAFVHGLTNSDYSYLMKEYNCSIHTIPTLLRPNIFNIKNNMLRHYIVGILGGGSQNASSGFIDSTVKIGESIIMLANYLKDEQFLIYCNDSKVSDALKVNLPNNIKVIDNYTNPNIIYKNAKAILCRAGRNTISEALYLHIPTILFSTSGDFRSVEQKKNISDVCNVSKGLMQQCNIGDNVKDVAKKLDEVINKSDVNYSFEPGNRILVNFIENL